MHEVIDHMNYFSRYIFFFYIWNHHLEAPRSLPYKENMIPNFVFCSALVFG